MLLRFRVQNHRSIRDEAELSMVSPSLRGATPPNGDWKASTVRVAGIYGANASGKSTIIDALDFLQRSAKFSATRWKDQDIFPYRPFALDLKHKTEPSLYELDFTVNGIRHAFGFRNNAEGIVEEWLYSYPNARRQKLYERSGNKFEFGRNLPGENVRLSRSVQANILFLSFGAYTRHQVIGRIHHEIVSHIRIAKFLESDLMARLQWVAKLVEDENARTTAESLLRLADFGISSIRVHSEEMPEALRDALRTFIKNLSLAVPDSADAAERADEYLSQAEKQIRFGHSTTEDSEDEARTLGISDESSGTVAWLALAMPAYDALRRGEIFVVDEIDSSLHPMLTATLIDLFRNEKVNQRGAQLIFTSHDTSLLGSLHGRTLAAEEVWLTEKNAEGATDLYSLAEFPVRARDNLERRYMQGRYGAVPVISREEIRQTLAEEAGTTT